MRLPRLLIGLVAALALFSGAVNAQEAAPSKEERIQRIRQLPPEEKARLKAALERFRALSPEKREALRAKARTVGVERLGELAGRDFGKLKQKHETMHREMGEVWKALGGSERIASLDPAERAFIQAEALRGFQRYCRQQLLEPLHLWGDFEAQTEQEKHARMEKGVNAAIRKLLDEQTPEAKARYLAMPAGEQRRERGRLLADWRLRSTIGFTRQFDGQKLFKFLDMAPQKRREFMQRRVRWYEIWTVLRQEGVTQEAMRTFLELRPDERAQVAIAFEGWRDLPASERRARAEQKIQELYGKGSLAAPRSPKRPDSRLRDLLLRDRMRGERRPGEPGGR